jgi:hypothetical protein
MERVTLKDLDDRVEVINGYTTNEADRFGKKVGPYFIGGAYGGYYLYKTIEHGYINAFSHTSHMTKRELYRRMGSFIDGLSVGSKLGNSS